MGALNLFNSFFHSNKKRFCFVYKTQKEQIFNSKKQICRINKNEKDIFRNEKKT